MTYNYTAGANVGQISSSVDGILGETLNYTYSSLYKLQGVSGAWSQAYTYDGFGNLTSKSAAGWYGAYAASLDPATNRQVGQTYDANGNQTSNGTYDVSNRLVSNTVGQSYAYDYAGKRVVKWTGTGPAELYFYGIGGQKLTTLTCDIYLNCGSPAYNVTFKGKLAMAKGSVVVTDRLGSVRWSAAAGGSAYFP